MLFNAPPNIRQKVVRTLMKILHHYNQVLRRQKEAHRAGIHFLDKSLVGYILCYTVSHHFLYRGAPSHIPAFSDETRQVPLHQNKDATTLCSQISLFSLRSCDKLNGCYQPYCDLICIQTLISAERQYLLSHDRFNLI